MEMIVTWGDCDPAGISYYAKNFDWFTNGRMQLLDFIKSLKLVIDRKSMAIYS